MKTKQTVVTGSFASVLAVIFSVEELLNVIGVEVEIPELSVIAVLSTVAVIGAFVGTVVSNWRAGRRFGDADRDGIIDLLDDTPDPSDDPVTHNPETLTGTHRHTRNSGA